MLLLSCFAIDAAALQKRTEANRLSLSGGLVTAVAAVIVNNINRRRSIKCMGCEWEVDGVEIQSSSGSGGKGGSSEGPS